MWGSLVDSLGSHLCCLPGPNGSCGMRGSGVNRKLMLLGSGVNRELMLLAAP